MHKLYYRFHPCMYWIVLSCVVINIIGDNYKAAFGCLEEEKIGLLKLKDFINNHNRSVPSTWGDKQVEDCCWWEGVICNENHDVFSKRIINLYLSPWYRYQQPLVTVTEPTIYDLDASLFQPFEELQDLTFQGDFGMQGVKGLLRLPKLQVLDLSNNSIYNDDFQVLINLTSLKKLGLSNNRLNGSLPEGLCTLTNLEELDLSHNAIEGVIPTCLSNFTSLRFLDLSNNLFSGSIPSNLFSGIGSFKSLDLSNNHLSGELVGNLFNGCEELSILKLSNNNLGGNLTNFFSNNLWLPQLLVLYLDNNNFSGDLRLETLRLAPSVGQLMFLDISNNSITGRFPDWIAELSQLQVLVLSKNHFQGKLPTSFCKLINIQVLDLSWNNFSDTLPPCTNLSMLYILHLQGNGFQGPLPTSLSRSSNIVTMDVRDNKFSGLIPAWINLLPDLTFFLLRGNVFYGSIPSEICQLENLRILDFAANSLSGSIPPCLSQIPIGKKKLMVPESEMAMSDTPLIFPFETDNSEIWPSNVPEEVQFITKSVYESYTGSILYSMVGIDLSLNRLTGPIPMHFGNWDNVRSLNLSYNYFNGSIPAALSSLINLESLDLSHNMFSGQIPSEMTQLTSLSAFSVAYNNLSGPTPTRSKQFGTFEARSYEGNPFLWGPPLDRNCSGGPTKMPYAKLFVESQQNDYSFKNMFLWSFLGSFVVSCIGAFGFFYFGTNILQIFLQWIGLEERIHHKRTVELPWKWINK